MLIIVNHVFSHGFMGYDCFSGIPVASKCYSLRNQEKRPSIDSTYEGHRFRKVNDKTTSSVR
jgi:hypothetical protein